jgi:hypothetical protein
MVLGGVAVVIVAVGVMVSGYGDDGDLADRSIPAIAVQFITSAQCCPPSPILTRFPSSRVVIVDDRDRPRRPCSLTPATTFVKVPRLRIRHISIAVATARRRGRHWRRVRPENRSLRFAVLARAGLHQRQPGRSLK